MTRGLIGLLIAVAMLAAPQAMTNQAIEAMVASGVPLATIVATIKSAARIQLTEAKENYDRLIVAGSSPAGAAEIMKAVHYRQYVGIDSGSALDAATPVPTAPTQAALSLATAPVPAVAFQVVSVARTEANLSAKAAQLTVTPVSIPPVQAAIVASATPAPPIKATAAEDAVVTAMAVRPEAVANREPAQEAFAPGPLSQNVVLGAAAVRRGPTDAPRVFLQSASKDTNRNAARESMEMSKDLERDCPGVKTTLNQQVADYTVLLNHIEGFLSRDNQMQVANKGGDLITNPREGGSIAGGMRWACALILNDRASMRRRVQP